MFTALAKTFIPRGLRNSLRDFYREKQRDSREREERKIPKVALAEKHMKDCELVLNREALLSRLKKGGHVAELGVNQGEFSQRILETTEPARLHLVDTWASERYHSGLYESVRKNYETLIQNGRVQIHRKLSTDAADDFPDNYFDWIYIDTDHSYAVTKAELLKYASKVKVDGVIAGHDYSMGNWVQAYRYGVIESVHEFCVEHGWTFAYLTLDFTEKQSFAIRRISQPV